MTTQEELFYQIGNGIPNSVAGQLFGKKCFKINGKAFICFFEEELVCKLTDETHKEALSLDGSMLFDPSKKNRPMREWVQISFDYQDRWEQFAAEAAAYVGQ